ncbi:MAG: efflux RND transporter permease subunit [Acidobacteriota bacterium]|nr:efflux RND transporter permease subunit [Acidobacteriota bacterium]
MEHRQAGSYLVTRPVAITMVFLAAVVFGALSYSRLALRLMPELTYPTITVRTEYPGAAPQEVESDISRPIEEAVGVVGGLGRISSISRAGVSDVVLEFDWKADMAEATQSVLEELDRVLLPEQAERPLILHYDPSEDAVLELSLASTREGPSDETELRRLRRLADRRIKRTLEPIRGVAAVRVSGGLEEEIQVLLDEEQLRRLRISAAQVIDRLAAENINLAGGTIRDGRSEYMVRTLGEFTNLQQIADTVVAERDGAPLRIKDLGRVVRSHKEREIITRTDGRPAVRVEIFKEADANIVDLAHRVRQAVGSADEGEESTSLAALLAHDEKAALKVVADRSLFIESSLREVRQAAILGGLLAVAVLLLFLRRLRPTAIIAASIPVSLAITFAPLNLLGVSLNIMSLGGLALGIGMLVDSSIVVLESIHRCREEGDTPDQAVVRGTREVRSAVFASTLTSVAVFFPMVFIEGVAGQAFGDLGTAVVVSLLASAAVALVLIPMLAALGGSGTRPAAPYRLRELLRVASARRFADAFRSTSLTRSIAATPFRLLLLAVALPLEIAGRALLALLILLFLLARLVGRGLAAIGRRARRRLPPDAGSPPRFYPKLLTAALSHPWLLLLAVTACLAATAAVLQRMESELLPEVHQGEFTVEVALPVGTPLDHTAEVLTPVEQALLAESEDIESLLLTLGFDSAQSQRSDEGEHTARFKVLLAPSRRPEETERRILRRIRRRLATIPDMEIRVVRPVLFSSKTPIEVEIQADDLIQLRALADQAADLLAELPELTDVESTQRRGAPEIQVIYDRDRLSRLGLDIRSVARLVRNKVQGTEATRYNLLDRRIPIVVRLGLDDRETTDEVRALDVNPNGTRPLPLEAVARVVVGEGPSEVRRIDGRRSALVTANLASGSLTGAAARIEEVLGRAMDWPLGTDFRISGQSEEWQRSRRSLWLVLALSVFLVYVIMAAQFESLIHPLVIMITIPLAFIGSIVAIWLTGVNISVVVLLGLIMLAGIVVNNAIVLVDYINVLRDRGLGLREAVVTAGGVRLRPILMTTATTVLGLLPMAVGWGDGAEIRRPMAIAVIAGLLSSTALTLVVIPVVYERIESLIGRRGRARR